MDRLNGRRALLGSAFLILSALTACATDAPVTAAPEGPTAWDQANATVEAFISETDDILGDSPDARPDIIARQIDEGNVERPKSPTRVRSGKLFVTHTPVQKAISAFTAPIAEKSAATTLASTPAVTRTPAPPVPTSVDYHALEVRADGALRLTEPPSGASDQNPAFSHDGSQIVFTRFEQRYNAGPAGLHLLDPQSGNTTRITPEEDQDNVNLPGSSWDAVGNRIVFSSGRDESDDLWSVSPDGSTFVRITDHTGPPMYYEPSWSPDGEWVVFEARNPGNGEDDQYGEIWKARADGSELTQLTEGHDDRRPNWSPASERVLFQRREGGDQDWNIYTLSPEGDDVQTVTTYPSSDTDASWSPDGNWIVYSSDHGDLPSPNIFVVSWEGGEPIRVTYSDVDEDGAPSWSPDGLWIAFESHPSDDEESPASLWVIAAPRLPDP